MDREQRRDREVDKWTKMWKRVRQKVDSGWEKKKKWRSGGERLELVGREDVRERDTAEEEIGIGLVGVSMAFGLTVLTMAYGVGHISGAHFNPAVTLGLWAGGRMEGKDVGPYIISQCVGGVVAAGVLYIIATGNGSDIGSFAANGYGEYSPGKYGLGAAIVSEFVMTFMFLMVILGATDEAAPKGFAGIAIGLALTLIHLISIPVTNTSVNPAHTFIILFRDFRQFRLRFLLHSRLHHLGFAYNFPSLYLPSSSSSSLLCFLFLYFNFIIFFCPPFFGIIFFLVLILFFVFFLICLLMLLFLFSSFLLVHF